MPSLPPFRAVAPTRAALFPFKRGGRNKFGGRKTRDRAQIVEESKDRELGAELHEFLSRDRDNIAQNFKYLLRIEMALGRYEEAALTALEVARRDQDSGNYRLAHQQLQDMTRLLRDQDKRPPQQLAQALNLLHSYVLVKTRVKLDDHLGAARLLVRVARNISRFASHVVPILTSTVIECQRAGLLASSYEHAATLMRPEYRQDINPVGPGRSCCASATASLCLASRWEQPTGFRDCPGPMLARGETPLVLLRGRRWPQGWWTKRSKSCLMAPP